jgi:hypothetical protein
MSIPAPLAPSLISAAFAGIQNCSLDKLRLSASEKAALWAAEVNPIEYTLANREEAYTYARVLLKILAGASGPSGPSLKVSRVTEMLADADALPLIYADPMGVMTHYAITKLHEVIVCLKEMKDGSDWRPLLRILHLGGHGDTFAQSE